MIRYSILVADENQRMREAVKSELEPRGYNIINAENGLDTLKIIKNENIHLLVLDLRLPDYSGVEIYHAVKGLRNDFLPCIFTSTDMTAGSLHDALAEEAITILPKPVDMPRLVKAVSFSVRKFYPENMIETDSLTQRRKEQ